ncbi:MAG: TIGR02281 family clan AA aspartic protease [Azonexus sp.]|nr:TIGR02281 family clan AA aspartic protease [Betaproteobacteria bacterium]MBK8917211.1 TIGR02281 family clan AA aspartic protease [Betaproteobacteria bacterium]MBP6035607.1 TIGR02281 family clan AA aspartic protease [Azonexus sp.]MBP6906159.1 TIGR02281 family clan AA aspartic protease [Azonexus sp.]
MQEKRGWHFMPWLLLALSSVSLAADVGLAGVMGSKAMLTLGGGDPEAVAIGQSYGGARVVAIQGDQVIVEIDGRRRPLKVGQHAVGNAGAGEGSKAILTSDGQGHFYANGTINGRSARFLVDTGATMVSLGAGDAKRLGLDPAKGKRGYSQTANGQVEVSKLTLDSVQVGDITLHQVDAIVHASGDLPFALLGMSFLNRTEMVRDGDTLTLRRRY